MLGPSSVPIVRDVNLAKADPELAVLSVMAHGQGNTDAATAIGRAAFLAAAGLDDARPAISDLRGA